jgi:hypothetical protein
MRDLIDKHWRRHVRNGQWLDNLTGCLLLLICAIIAAVWLLNVMRLDCQHPRLAPQLSYCSQEANHG